MTDFRKPTTSEQRLLDALIDCSNLQLEEGWRDTLFVESMNDGGMGSLLLFPKGATSQKRLLGRVASSLNFEDEDGVQVSVTLNLDKDGKLFEIDSWKVNFAPLIRIPDDL